MTDTHRGTPRDPFGPQRRTHAQKPYVEMRIVWRSGIQTDPESNADRAQLAKVTQATSAVMDAFGVKHGTVSGSVGVIRVAHPQPIGEHVLTKCLHAALGSLRCVVDLPHQYFVELTVKETGQ